MKAGNKIVALLFLATIILILAGCATTNHDDTTTGAVAGGLLGGGLTKAAGGSANKGAIAGGLIGAGIGVLSDAQNRKDAEREQKINQMIEKETQRDGSGVGGGNSPYAMGKFEGQKNAAYAKSQKDYCMGKFMGYKESGIKIPYNCEAVLNDAVNRAEEASELSTSMLSGGYGGKCSDRYLLAHGVRPGSRHADMWCQQFRDDEQGYGRVYSYRR